MTRSDNFGYKCALPSMIQCAPCVTSFTSTGCPTGGQSTRPAHPLAQSRSAGALTSVCASFPPCKHPLTDHPSHLLLISCSSKRQHTGAQGRAGSASAPSPAQTVSIAWILACQGDIKMHMHAVQAGDLPAKAMRYGQQSNVGRPLKRRPHA